jgi:hypothetical protein
MKITILKLALEQGHTIVAGKNCEGYFHTCSGDACETCPFDALDAYGDVACLLNDKDKLSQEAVDYVKQHHPELLI